ncbi:MAG: response regulator [Deltaproteobacteria bacterium]|nr:response regulator [Deltaproteobacteria bacterium]
MRKILIVDDEIRIRKMYNALLISEGFEAFEAQNAQEARKILKEADIDLILLDIKMDEVEGNELYEIIRLFHRQCKVIVTSVYPLNEQKKRIQGAADYYDKAQGIDILLAKVDKVLQN